MPLIVHFDTQKDYQHNKMAMRAPYQRVFQRSPQLLTEMLVLRLSGYPERRLAEMYEVDRTSIRHWCEYFNIHPQLEITKAQRKPYKKNVVIVIQPPKPQTYKYQDLLEDEAKVNPGKSYIKYRIESIKRQIAWKR